jgi:hypothetical protein
MTVPVSGSSLRWDRKATSGFTILARVDTQELAEKGGLGAEGTLGAARHNRFREWLCEATLQAGGMKRCKS